MAKRGSMHLKERDFIERYRTGQKLHIVDFVKDKSFMGNIISRTDNLLNCKLDVGYNISISFAELKCSNINSGK